MILSPAEMFSKGRSISTPKHIWVYLALWRTSPELCSHCIKIAIKCGGRGWESGTNGAGSVREDGKVYNSACDIVENATVYVMPRFSLLEEANLIEISRCEFC